MSKDRGYQRRNQLQFRPGRDMQEWLEKHAGSIGLTIHGTVRLAVELYAQHVASGEYPVPAFCPECKCVLVPGHELEIKYHAPGCDTLIHVDKGTVERVNET